MPAHQAQFDRYEKSAAAVKNAIAGLTREQLLAHPVPGTWSIQQIVIHLADCELVFADRMKWIIAEDRPSLPGFDENKWMEALAVNDRPADEGAQLIDLTRRQMSRILRQLPPAAFERFGVHSQMGNWTLATALDKANVHLEHHLKFIEKKRALILDSNA